MDTKKQSVDLEDVPEIIFKTFLEKLMDDLKIDEGVKYEIYLDHLGLPTFGIGHLIKQSDPEHEFPVGTPVSKARVKECFDQDIQQTIRDCNILFEQFEYFPDEVRLVIANMMFNLGRTRLSGFKKFGKAINEHKYNTAADEMMDSKWYRQVTVRAERLRQRIIAVDI